MPLAVKVDITPQPLDIRLFGARRQVPRAHALACSGEEASQRLAWRV